MRVGKKKVNLKEHSFIRSLYVFSAGLPVLLSVILLFINNDYWPVLGILMGLFVVGFLSIHNLQKKGKSVNWFITIAVINFLFIIPELFLRVIDFHYESGIQIEEDLEFGGLRPEHYMYFVPDKYLFWKLPSSMKNVNSLGFPGKEISTPKPTGEFRIIYLGDSVTQLGFGEYVAKYLNAYYASDSVHYKSITLAVSGYSSYQGKVLAERYTLKFEPDLVVVLFGWNDHWLAYRARDSEMELTFGQNLWEHLNHYSRMLQLTARVLQNGKKATAPGLLNTVRVLPNEYRENLSKINSIFESKNIPVLFITAPTSYYQLGVPDYLIKENYALCSDSAISMHKRYNQIVRDLAKEKNIYLLDLEKDYDSLANLDEIFSDDGIHLTEYGIRLTARRILKFIVENIFDKRKIVN